MTLVASHEVIAIGSSPLMLLRALELAQAGQRVRIIDRAAVPGGGWAAPPLLGFDNVEIGVHLLENRPDFYAVLRSDLGLDLADEGGTSFGLWRGRRLEMGRTRLLFHAMVAGKALSPGSTDRARRIGMSAVRAARQLGTQFVYPRTGCAAITMRLLERLDSAGATLMLGTGVSQASLDGDRKLVCQLADGCQLRADKLLISSRAHTPLVIDGVQWRPRVERSVVYSVVIHLTGIADARFGYVEVLGDPFVKRVRDVGSFAQPCPAQNDRLFCVQLRHYPGGGDTALGAAALAALQRLGLITAATLVAASRQQLVLETITDGALRDLTRRTGGRIEGLPTTDLADGYVSLRGGRNRA